MKRMLILAVAVVALVFTGNTDVSAQSYNNGYGFGTGVNRAIGGQRGYGAGCFAGGIGFGQATILDRRSAPPYFAQFPPVYYSKIVRRPYGVSPYAAPAGIAPVELSMQAESAKSVTIRNPFVNRKNASVSTPAPKPAEKKSSEMNNKTTAIAPTAKPIS